LYLIAIKNSISKRWVEYLWAYAKLVLGADLTNSTDCNKGCYRRFHSRS